MITRERTKNGYFCGERHRSTLLRTTPIPFRIIGYVQMGRERKDIADMRVLAWNDDTAVKAVESAMRRKNRTGFRLRFQVKQL